MWTINKMIRRSTLTQTDMVRYAAGAIWILINENWNDMLIEMQNGVMLNFEGVEVK